MIASEHSESKYEEETDSHKNGNYDPKKVFDFSESVVISVDEEDDNMIGISGNKEKKQSLDIPPPAKTGVFAIFQFADATDKMLITFAVLMSALSGANQVHTHKG